jgi:hypothetical protein
MSPDPRVSADLLAKNRTDRPLCFVSARLIKPKITAEAIQTLVIPKLLTKSECGSGWNIPACAIPASAVVPVRVIIYFRGTPKQKLGALVAVAVSDEEGKRVKLQLKSFSP